MVENLYDLGVLAAGFARGRSAVGIEYRDELPFLTRTSCASASWQQLCLVSNGVRLEISSF